MPCLKCQTVLNVVALALTLCVLQHHLGSDLHSADGLVQRTGLLLCTVSRQLSLVETGFTEHQGLCYHKEYEMFPPKPIMALQSLPAGEFL